MSGVAARSSGCGRNATAPGPSASRSQALTGVSNVGAGTYGTRQATASIATTSDRASTTGCHAGRSSRRHHVTAKPAAAATPNESSTPNRAGARTAWKPNTQRCANAYTLRIPSGPSANTTPAAATAPQVHRSGCRRDRASAAIDSMASASAPHPGSRPSSSVRPTGASGTGRHGGSLTKLAKVAACRLASSIVRTKPSRCCAWTYGTSTGRHQRRRHQPAHGERRKQAPERDAAGARDECEAAEAQGHQADHRVVDRTDGGQPEPEAEPGAVLPAPARHHAMQRPERQRQEVQRLQLQVQHVREAVRAETPHEAADDRTEAVVEHLPQVPPHRPRTCRQRRDEDDVVAEDGIAPDRVDRRHQQRLQQQVIGEGQRLARRMEDRRIEDAAVQPRRRGEEQLAQIPAQREQVEIRDRLRPAARRAASADATPAAMSRRPPPARRWRGRRPALASPGGRDQASS